MKGNTSYWSARILHSSFVGINCWWINTKSEIYTWLFLAETLFLLKITSQELVFRSIAKECILKEHIPVKFSQLFHLVNPLTSQKLKYREMTIFQIPFLFCFIILSPPVLKFYIPEDLIKKHDASTKTATEHKYPYIYEKDLLLQLFIF